MWWEQMEPVYLGVKTRLNMARLTVMLLVAVVAVSLTIVTGDSDADKEIQEAIVPVIAECSKEHGINADDLAESKKNKDLEGVDGCLIECVFKKIGVMDDDNSFAVEKFAENAKKFLKKNGESEKIEEMAKNCVSVFEKASDEKCGKSKMLLACLMEQKDKLDL